ncbi:MAG: hypothetical protein QM764_22315 [Chitinophagaceae bacterium]
MRRWIFFRVREPEATPVAAEPVTATAESIRQQSYDQLWKLRESHWDAMSNTMRQSSDDTEFMHSLNSHKELLCIIARRLGEVDGTSGAKDFSFNATAVAQADDMTGQIVSFLEGRAGSFKLLIDDKIEEIKAEEAAESNYKEQIETIEKSKYRDRSLAMFWFFIVFAFVMIIADIVVSLNLVNKFGIGNAAVGAGIWERIRDFDLLPFSLGIAFCTVYFKILYDDYIIGRPGEGILSVMDMRKKGVAAAFFWTDWGLKLAVKLLIGAGLLIMLSELSRFRMMFTFFGESSDEMRTISATHPELSFILLRCFQGITIILPIISGICLSIALNIRSNRRSLKKWEEKLQKSGVRLSGLRTDLEKCTVRELQFKTHLKDWSDKTAKIKLLSELFTANYDQGFRIGYRSNHGSDFYTVIEERRNEIFAKQLDKLI